MMSHRSLIFMVKESRQVNNPTEKTTNFSQNIKIPKQRTRNGAGLISSTDLTKAQPMRNTMTGDDW